MDKTFNGFYVGDKVEVGPELDDYADEPTGGTPVGQGFIVAIFGMTTPSQPVSYSPEFYDCAYCEEYSGPGDLVCVRYDDDQERYEIVREKRITRIG